MTLREFKSFFKKQQRILMDSETRNDDRLRIFVSLIKLMEELGELCEQILGFKIQQRTEKMRSRNTTELEKELADVLITIFILAEDLKIDAFKAMENKIKVIKSRYKEWQ